MINFYFLPSVLVSPLLGLVVDRFPQNQSYSRSSPSHCDHCQHVLGVWDLSPSISQLLHRFLLAF
ncbi:MAG: prepilin peptidase [Streptococcus sp.]